MTDVHALLLKSFFPCLKSLSGVIFPFLVWAKIWVTCPCRCPNIRWKEEKNCNILPPEARVALLVGIRGDRSTTTCFQCMQHKSALKLKNKFAQIPTGNSHLRERYIWRPSEGGRKKKFAALCGLVVGHFWLYCVIRLPIPLLPSPRLLLMGMLAKLETAPEIASAFFPNSIFTSDIGSLQNVAIDLI